MAATPVSLKQHFADLIDPRDERSRLARQLLDVVGIALRRHRRGRVLARGGGGWPRQVATGSSATPPNVGIALT